MDDFFPERYRKLNEEQRNAVDSIEGPVLVIAGPGSGKTELLSLRVANILRQTDTPASSILCLTFTDAAAINMRKRLTGLLGPEAFKVAIHTFHSFGSEIINRNPEYFYNGASYNAADQLAQYEIIEDILKDMPHDSLLRSYHPEQGYTYLKDILKKISELKKGGLTPADFKEILEENKSYLEQVNPLLCGFFAERISNKMFEKIPELITGISSVGYKARSKSLPYSTIKETLLESLSAAYEMIYEGEKPSTKPLTQWKSENIKKDDKNETVLADLERIQKQFELCEIYDKYQNLMHKKGYFDFEDMLLDTVNALEKHPALKYNLQERYLYVLVDEFQDTNGVQMRILDKLLDSPVNENRPDILAVGDDDQAIYKFQGANIDNIMDFEKRYRNPSLIVLQKNYRSTQQILDFIRRIVLKGTDRLENRMPDKIKKELISANAGLESGEIVEKEFPTSLHERVWIAESIKHKLEKENADPSEIAVIAPKHAILEETAKVLDFFGISVAYERKKDLFEQDHIRELIQMLRFIDSIATKSQSESDEYLPVILSFPFWKIDETEVWKISAKAYRERKLWLEVMLESNNEFLCNIAKFFIKLGNESKEKIADEIIDMITGVASEKLYMDEDGGLPEQIQKSVDNTFFVSPYKLYYFNEAVFENSRLDYMERLQSLQDFMDRVRKHKGKDSMSVADVVAFVDLHEKHKLSVYHEMRFNDENKAVNLMTAHGSKGLEFENVYILNCQENAWMKNRMRDKLTFPSNLPLAPEAENEEDNLRLFYVALSRAKRNLYLSRNQYDDKGDEQLCLRFIEENDSVSKKKENIGIGQVEEIKNGMLQEKGLEKLRELNLRAAMRKHQVRNVEQEVLLKELVRNYTLSVTHLNNYLNIVNGGPRKFLEQNLLHFPTHMEARAAFGSAMHEALNDFSKQARATKTIPQVSFMLERFEKSLTEKRLNKSDFKLYLEKGKNCLNIYYEKRRDDFDVTDQTEFNFSGQGVVLGKAELTGKIDKMKYDQETRQIQVFDFKTGKAMKDLEHGQDYEKIKAWQYKNQLIFYKILVENARDFKGRYDVRTGFLEFLEPVGGDIRLIRYDITDDERDKMVKLIRIVYDKIIALDFPDTEKYEKCAEGIQCFVDDLLAGTE